MSLLQDIRAKQLEARKAKSLLAALYTTLVSEAAMVGKNDGNRETSDLEVIAVVKKFIKNIDETLAVIQHPETRAGLEAERGACAEFLPKQFDDETLTRVISSIKVEINAGPKDMGRVMGLLKQRFDGQYDGKAASTITKTVLAG